MPIGSEEHRARIIKTHRINPHDQIPLNEKIKIANKGNVVRSLGA